MRCPHCDFPAPEHALFCPTLRTGSDLCDGAASLFAGDALRIGPYALFPLSDAEIVAGRPPGAKAKEEGIARTWRVLGPSGVDMVLADIEYESGVRVVKVLRRLPDGHPRFDVIVNRLRLVLEPTKGKWFFFLRQARLNGKERPTLCDATPEQLRDGAGVPVLETLVVDFGATAHGPGRDLSDHRPNLSKKLAVLMPEGSDAHLAAFVLTRIATTDGGFHGYMLEAS